MAVGSDRDHAVSQSTAVADVLVRDIVGGFALLAVAGLVDTQHERSSAQRLAQQVQALCPQLLNRPLGIGQEVMQRLRVGLGRLGQPRQRLALGLGQQAEVQLGELLEMPHVVEHRALVSALVVDEANGTGCFTHFGHGDGLLPLASACIRHA